MLSHIEVFLNLTEAAVAIRDADMSWETKYELIFSKEVSRKIFETGISIDWYDPDMTHQADVCAFVGALEEKAAEMKVMASV